MTDAAPNGWPLWVLRGFREGQRRALAEVYRMHVEEIARQLRFGFSFEAAGAMHRFVGYASAFELQDALHETFVRAFEPRARLSYDGIRPYGPYLKTIARNVVLRGFRAQRARFVADAVDAQVVEATLPDPGAIEPDVAIGREQVRSLVARFVADLSEDDRRLITVRFVEGVSQRDAAERLGLGRQQVRSREDKLRRRLLAYLRRHVDGDERQAWSMLTILLGDALMLAEALREGVGPR